ncbi:hypothetical protein METBISCDRAFT_29240 [Metschnikowia bicuspidata]|uniref:Uncharacterized protein n=1 Tax=Metschnikowia bicuspidata TaxID=27322 RepID=A0A4P9Z6U5_9ASCO|nr:hypothetical protein METBISCDRAFT_29240 [Metschnikowia bicuspidata]
MIDTESTSDTAALDTANLSSNSIVAKEPRASLMEMIQTLETKVTTALRDLEQEDAQFTARLTQLSDKIESYKRNLNKGVFRWVKPLCRRFRGLQGRCLSSLLPPWIV